jgi:hypothetical protein
MVMRDNINLMKPEVQFQINYITGKTIGRFILYIGLNFYILGITKIILYLID